MTSGYSTESLDVGQNLWILDRVLEYFTESLDIGQNQDIRYEFYERRKEKSAGGGDIEINLVFLRTQSFMMKRNMVRGGNNWIVCGKVKLGTSY